MKWRLLFIVLVFWFIFPVNINAAGCGAWCDTSADCTGCAPSSVCDGAYYDAAGELQQGKCYYTIPAECPTSWGPWSACVNYCETRLCTSGVLEQIRSCGGGTCGGSGGGCFVQCFDSVRDPSVETYSCPGNVNYGVLFNTYENSYGTHTGGHIGDRWTCGPQGSNPSYYTQHERNCGVPDGQSCGSGWYEVFGDETTGIGPYFYAAVSGIYEFMFYGLSQGTFFSMDLNGDTNLPTTLATCTNANDNYIGISPWGDPDCANCYIKRVVQGISYGTCGFSNCPDSEDRPEYSNVPDGYQNPDPNWWNYFTLNGTDWDRLMNRECVLSDMNYNYKDIVWSKRYLTAGYHRVFYRGGATLKMRMPVGSAGRAYWGEQWILPSQLETGCPFKACNCQCDTPTAPTLISPVNNGLIQANQQFTWNQIAEADWAGECSATTSSRRYEICIASTATGQGACPTGLTFNVTLPAGNPAGVYDHFSLNPTGTRYWKVRSVNACGTPSVWSEERSATFNTPIITPTIDILEPTNTPTSPPGVTPSLIPTSTPGITVVPTDPYITPIPTEVHGADSGVNQICDPALDGSRTVNIRVTAVDPDGGADVAYIELRYLDGAGVQRTIRASAPGQIGVNGNNATAQFAVTFGPSETRWVDFYVNVNDTETSTGFFLARRVRLWDCMIQVSGTVYDREGLNVVCPANRFDTLNPVDASTGFTTANFSSSGTTVSANSPNGYSYGGVNLIWGRSYISSTNPLNAQGIQGEWRNSGAGAVCNMSINETGWETLVDPYTASGVTQITVNFAVDENQDPWFNTVGGGVLAVGQVSDPVPPTCPNMAGCTPAISISGTNMDNSIVSGTSISGLCPACTNGSPNDISFNGNIVNTTYGYNYFYNEIYAQLGIGTTMTGTQNFSDVLAAASTGIVFVDGGLNIDTTNSVAVGDYYMVIVRGSIVVSNSVDRIEGIFVTDGSFIASSGSSNTGLSVYGSIYAEDGVNLGRGYADSSENNDKPGVSVVYRPDFLFSTPARVTNELADWKETAN